MLQLLQYLVGTSIAAFVPVADTTIVHSVVAGPTFRGSSLGLVGAKGCRLRGRMPGSEAEAWRNEDMDIKKR
jgi:hypothetical protein